MGRIIQPTRRGFLSWAFAAGARLLDPGGISYTAPASSPGTEPVPDVPSKPQPSAIDPAREVHSVEDRILLLEFSVDGSGLTLTRIRNKAIGFEHLVAPSPLFEFNSGSGDQSCLSNQGVLIDRVLPEGARRLEVSGRAAGFPLEFSLRIEASTDEGVALARLQITNRGTARLLVRAVVPKITGLTTQAQHRPMMAVIPQEVGTVVLIQELFPAIGMPVNPRIGLPTAMNSMELLAIYDPSGQNGLFFADVEGDLEHDIAPLQFTMSGDSLLGYWRTELAPSENATLPAFAIGVYGTGDWHKAVDYYVQKHRPRWHFPQIPTWFRDQGAIYSFSGAGAGGIYMDFPQQSLKTRIESFQNLPQLLDEAESLGTNILYLWDYWEGASEGGRPAYWNKGDYLPRRDMGGETAFREGIRRVHDRGGRVITYVEPFIIFYYSRIGEEKGEAWGGRDPLGKLYEHYPQNYSMPAPFRPWQDYLVEISERLVRDYDVDGIYLDSWGWQMNWPMQNRAEGVLYSPKQYNQGVLAIADRVRTAVQALKPDGVVIGESTSGPLARHWHGGLSADFAWHAKQNQGRIIASPVRYGVPEVNFITNGRNLNELNQVFAAGHNLALANVDLVWAPYVKRLVKVRQEYKDALIYGLQAYQPETGEPDVAAYFYRGAEHDLITAVNTSSERAYGGHLKLDDAKPNSRWRDLLSDEVIIASGGRIALRIPPQGLRILLRETIAEGR